MLVLGTAGVFYMRRQTQPVMILLDGKPVASAPNISQANDLLHRAELSRTHNAFPADSIVRLQTVQFERLNASVPVDADTNALAKLSHALKLHVRAYVITVDGQPAMALPSDSAAADTLHQVKEHFAQMPPPADIVGEPEFVEKVAVTQQAVDVSQAKASAEEATPLFWTTKAGKVYKVQRGDTGLAIAIRQHITLRDLLAGNPQADMNRLRVGDTLNIQKGATRISVRVQKRFSREEPVVASAPPAEAGLRRVTYVVTFVNGAETHRDVQNISVIRPPRARTEL